MKLTTKVISFSMAIVMLFASCSSSTMIVSNPGSAKLYVDGEEVGETPYKLRDTKIVGSVTEIRIEKEGYKPYMADITKDEEANVGAIVGGLFFLVPFLWTLKYKPIHSYQLVPLASTPLQTPAQQQQNTAPKSKAEKLRELKLLLDDKIITQEEFEKAKAKILEMEN